MTSAASVAMTSESAYQNLRSLIPSLAHELDNLRTSLREHNLWLQRYGFENTPAQVPSSETVAPPSDNDPDLPAYSGADVPQYTVSANQAPRSRTEEVEDRKNQIIEWLREGEEVLREYSARFAQLGQELGMEHEDILGTWKEGEADNALPDYERIEGREELMVGGVGEVPPPYVGSSQTVR